MLLCIRCERAVDREARLSHFLSQYCQYLCHNGTSSWLRVV
nr:MAG TPA: hypothetical protein [Caudoviricetes sp.]